MYSERTVAFLRLDDQFRVASVGGHLSHYGLESLTPGEPATEQFDILEGMLPIPESPFLLPAIELRSGCAADLHLFSGDACTWIVLLDVTVERDTKQRMQQKAYEMTLLQEKEALLNRKLNAANAALRQSREELENSQKALLQAHGQIQRELEEAAAYVRSLLPAPVEEPIAAEWHFVPSIQLGGDAFGYHWIDPDHFAIYLLDVCGHGVGPSLLSVAVLHLLQSTSLRDVDFRRPAAVLSALNNIYQMERSSDLYFTMWYGVFRPRDQELDFACAGHPPAILVDDGTGKTSLLKSSGLPIGLMPSAKYADGKTSIEAGQQLYLFSDGAYEIERPDGSMMTLDDLVAMVGDGNSDPAPALQVLYEQLLHCRDRETLDDDFSMMRFRF